MSKILLALKQKVAETLPQVTYIIGYGTGFDPLHMTPLFIRKPEEINDLQWNRFCIHNLATYLPPQKRPPGWLFEPDEKIGVILKGCDSRSVMQLLGEDIIKRDKLVIIGIPCEGIIDVNKLRMHIDDQLRRRIDIHKVSKVELDEKTINVFTDTAEVSFDIKELLHDKCLNCEYPNPLIYDELVGEKKEKHSDADTFAPLSDLERMSLEEREAFWEKEFSRCIRCNACRNVCPICYCQNQCLLDTRTPHWVKERVNPPNNQWYHLIRAFHLAGRCTECGECARVCPVNIPINLLPMKLNRELLELFNWRSGITNEKSPLMSFKLEEESIP